MDENIKAFVVYISSFRSKITIYPVRKAQIALLLAKKVTILAKYSDFANVFLEELPNIFPEQIRINDHAIKLEEGKQPLYGSIYNLGPVEFEIFKTYIKINPANGFIKASKSSASAPIMFVHKLDSSFCLYVNY